MATTTISSGVVSSSLTISSGDRLVVLSGGEAEEITISDGASAIVSAGGIVSGALVDSGGALSGVGTLQGATSALGSVNGLTIVGDGAGDANLTLSAGAPPSSGLTVTQGGEIDDFSVVVATTLENSGSLLIEAGGLASNTVVLSGAAEGVRGQASGTVISSGGKQEIEPRGASFGATVMKFGAQIVGSTGSAVGTVVSAGGKEYVQHGAASTATVLSGGVEMVSGSRLSDPLAVSSETVIKSGGHEEVGIVGEAIRTKVSAGGLLTVTSGTTVSAMVLGGGKLQVSSGAVDRAANIERGGSEYVYSSGLASGAVVHSGGSIFLSGGGDGGVQVYNGAVETVGAGGTATGTIVRGTERVYSGGVVSGTVVSVGLVSVFGGGVVSGMSLSAAGKLIDNGRVLIGGAATFAGSISGAGSLAETGTGDLVLSGDGSAFTGQAVVSGGTIELAHAGAVGTGSVAFAARAVSETLQIDAADTPAAGGTFSNTISGFSAANDFIDLRSIAFVSGATATASGGVLTLSDGGASYRFHLAGGIGSAFVVAGDGHGGTLIDVAAAVVDPTGATASLISPQVAAFVHAAAALSPSKAAVTSPITSGGTSGFAALVGGAGSAGGRG